MDYDSQRRSSPVFGTNACPGLTVDDHDHDHICVR